MSVLSLSKILKIIKKLKELCAITFGGIMKLREVVAGFKSQKFMLFYFKKGALLDSSKHMIFCDLKTAKTVACVVIPPNVTAHNT